MKIPMPDGSYAEVTVEEYTQLAELGLVAKLAPVVPKTQGELLREAFDTKFAAEKRLREGNGHNALMPVAESEPVHATVALLEREEPEVVEIPLSQRPTEPARFPARHAPVGPGAYRAAGGQVFIPYSVNEKPIIEFWVPNNRNAKIKGKELATKLVIEHNLDVSIRTMMHFISNMALEYRGIERIAGTRLYQMTEEGKNAQFKMVGRPRVALRTWRITGDTERV